jgi:hypothetical protein
MQERLIVGCARATLIALVLAAPMGASGAQATASHAVAARSGAGSIMGEWRFVRAQVAPWVVEKKSGNPNAKGWIGRRIRFEPTRVVGPGALGCAHAVYRPSRFDADALFQGALPAPAAGSAEQLGIVGAPLAGTTLDCDSGLFEYHRVDANTAVVALDNVIWTLDRSPGAFALDSTPAGAVQRLLERHFAGSMGFDARSVRTKSEWLTGDLRARIARYFAKPSSPNEVPAIDGDPFTDSQEYPTRFSVGAGVAQGDSATVTVRFSDGHRVRPVVYALRRQRDAWRVDDLRYENRETLRQWLR